MNARSKRLIFFAPMALIGMVLFAFIGGELVMRLWNWLMPSLFGWPRVSLEQALGLLALCRILFGGTGWFGGNGWSGRSTWRRRMSERWEKMTPEERERMRQGWRGQWGFVPPAGEGKEL
jgi:hypothetical protein